MSDFIETAHFRRPFWKQDFDGGPDRPAFTRVWLDWPGTMYQMLQEARKNYDQPLRFEVSWEFENLVKDVPEKMFDLPVIVSSGSLIRLICGRRTYETVL
jgi:hypothetical protein